MAGAFDWNGFEQAVAGAVVHTVRAAVRERPAAPGTVAALGAIHREPAGVIALPRFAMTTVDALSRPPAGWAPDWLPEHHDWQRTLTAYACRGDLPQWQDAFQRYLTALTQACRSARRQLLDARAVDADLVVLVLDDEHREALLRRVLPAPELHRLFPDLDPRRTAPAPSITSRPGILGGLVDAGR